MEDLPESYTLESVEQLRAIADELRLRILRQLVEQAMTVSQLAVVLGQAPNKVNYHVHELERVGLLKRVETREKGGFLEKYYRAVARNINGPDMLIRSLPSDEAIELLTQVVHPLFQGVIHAGQHLLHTPPAEHANLVIQLSPGQYWLTPAELADLSTQLNGLLASYTVQRNIDQEHAYTTLWLAYPSLPALHPQDETLPPSVSASTLSDAPAKPLKRELTFIAGTKYVTRQDLEESLAQGEAWALYMVGTITFAEDIPPALVERAISRFHLWGKLTAASAVREVLKRKGEEAHKRQNPRSGSTPPAAP
jgi:DNA-binding transcriptional ArsR family regulator